MRQEIPMTTSVFAVTSTQNLIRNNNVPLSVDMKKRIKKCCVAIGLPDRIQYDAPNTTGVIMYENASRHRPRSQHGLPATYACRVDNIITIADFERAVGLRE